MEELICENCRFQPGCRALRPEDPTGCIAFKPKTSTEKKTCGDCADFRPDSNTGCARAGYGTLATNSPCDRFRPKTSAGGLEVKDGPAKLKDQISTAVFPSTKIDRGGSWVVKVYRNGRASGFIQPGGMRSEKYCDYPTKLLALDAVRLSGLTGQYLKFQGEEKDTKKCGHPDFYKLLEQMADLHSRKNHDYAGTSDPLKNLRACERLNLAPFLGVLVRLQDKWSRLEEFVKSGQLMVKNESVIDTLMDNAVYSLLAIVLYREQQEKDKNVAG